MKNLALLVLVVSLLSACKKNILSTKIEGEVVGLTEGAPIEGATVYLYRTQSGGFLMPSTGEVVLKTTTDPKGKFLIDHKLEGGDYSIIVRKEGYFDETDMTGVESYYNLSGFGNLVKKKKTLYLQETSLCTIVFKNKSSWSDSCTISLNGFSPKNTEIPVKKIEQEETIFENYLIASNKIESYSYSIDSKYRQEVYKTFQIESIPVNGKKTIIINI